MDDLIRTILHNLLENQIVLGCSRQILNNPQAQLVFHPFHNLLKLSMLCGFHIRMEINYFEKDQIENN